MRNIKLLLEYDGTDFAGWQVQKGHCTVQGVVQQALKQLLQEQVNLIGSSRTDSGVHAQAQVANFRTENPLACGRIRLGLNSLLPQDVVIHRASEVVEDFHARYDANYRRYRYVLAKRPAAVGRHYYWFPKFKYDLELMKSCSQLLVGEHNFKSFCRGKSAVKHHRCQVEEVRWTGNENEIYFEIKANRFLHGMVRTIVGTLLEVGRGKISAEDFKTILEREDRIYGGPTAPARGLFLTEVGY